ncbi:S41 family peptidase [Sedimentibacter sp. zth1]|uniref:S41 family peptidase n=1 Tax=Sedimentibacter sp. zth1 TaxID=2816908 RepID=UPI001A9112E9|nr:S41 family peptidase [Sedimentibacter sp. zth1]QSX04671.1 S41 family peptidase [Sedimentibacter sp. zth1]
MFKRKSIRIITYILAGLILMGGILLGYYKLFIDPYRQTVRAFEKTMAITETLSKKEALEDLDFLYEKLQNRHPLWSEKDNNIIVNVEEKYIEIRNGIKEEVSVLEFYKACSEMLSLFHDGHTFVVYNNDFRVIDDFSQIEQYGAPVKINGVLFETVLDNFKKHSSYEFDFYIEKKFLRSMYIVDINLMLADIDVSQGVTFTFEINGEEVDFDYNFIPYMSGESNEKYKWVYYEIDVENGIGIFTLKQCNYNEEYKLQVKDFFTQVKEKGIPNVIVDLRGNGGGNSSVANEFFNYMSINQYNSWDSDIRLGWYTLENRDIVIKNKKSEPLFDGELYVLTDTWTYSAAMDFAMLVKDNRLGTLIGEPSGNSPDSFGDLLCFDLPNSHIGLGVSLKRWYRIDQTKAGDPVMPDYEVPAEEALKKAYELIKKELEE